MLSEVYMVWNYTKRDDPRNLPFVGIEGVFRSRERALAIADAFNQHTADGDDMTVVRLLVQE